ncbi:uncharacterized protein EI90DRAFT_2654946 [Cantharellus anzutake]|uniref:uncharacterized protein n=1 Tax=Cantharellus anzutake TaxID=1750568 RepID=UPI0019042241|nr:uncharacterized protein EI90DRAFT_2654946 [Cantharellus anzutake]KAF8337470.1 hypothetical protein EI90DRAFT_2654946 [Cantharellus anzutake]
MVGGAFRSDLKMLDSHAHNVMLIVSDFVLRGFCQQYVLAISSGQLLGPSPGVEQPESTRKNGSLDRPRSSRVPPFFPASQYSCRWEISSVFLSPTRLLADPYNGVHDTKIIRILCRPPYVIHQTTPLKYRGKLGEQEPCPPSNRQKIKIKMAKRSHFALARYSRTEFSMGKAQHFLST